MNSFLGAELEKRGRHSLSSFRRVTPTSPATDGDAELAKGKKSLPKGDVYHGEFVGNAPHGTGKYLWADGCMYEGEWRRGKAAGKGMFSWPSGATYVGEFRAGRMHGLGTLTSPDGGTYCGSWVADSKHGFGRKLYRNGDYYEGFWQRNVQEEQGRYVWRNGNEYVGEWNGGVIFGRGVLILANGNRYDGHWENSVPKGSGVFTWPDGSCYVGTWEKTLRRLNGTFYPPSRPPTPPTKGGDAAAAEKGFQKIGICDSDGDDTRDASLLCRSGTHFDQMPGVSPAPAVQLRRSPCPFSVSGEAKKPGLTIYKGHKNYDLVLILQLGITHSVGMSASVEMGKLQACDFDNKEKFWTRFPPEGSETTPPHQFSEFRWKDYCPMVFRHLKNLFDVDPTDFILAVCGSDSLRELSSPGKSGSLFYLTHDNRFIIKTVRKSDVKVLLRMLPSYYQHQCQYPNSLVTKFYGVHCIKPAGGQKVRFVVMGNLFCSKYPIHRRFDLKGSSFGRTTEKAEWEIDETTTFKDLDLNLVFHLHKSWFHELLWQIEMDCEFLEAERIMDYSLLVGVHFRDEFSESVRDFSDILGFPNDKLNYGLIESVRLGPIDSRKHPIRLGSNMPARAVTASRSEEQEHPLSIEWLAQTGQDHEVIIYFGIIDILQDYDISKKLEHAYKSLQVDPSSISAVSPKLYSRRFRDFISAIFVEETS